MGGAWGGWETVFDQGSQGIKLQERSVNGTNVREFRAEVRVKSTLTELVHLLQDTQNYPEWMHRIAQVTIVKQDDPVDYQVYTVIESPWPFHNRDVFVHTHISQNATTGTVLFRSISEPAGAGLMPGCVRMPEMDSDWLLTPESDDQVKVVFRGFGLPGGAVPDWAVNMVVTDLPYGSLRNLQRQISRHSYQETSGAQNFKVLEFQDLHRKAAD